MNAALSPTPPLDWHAVAPEDWQYLADLIAVPPLRPSGLYLRAAARARAACACTYCTRPRHAVETDIVDEPCSSFDRVDINAAIDGQATARPRLRFVVGPFGLRHRDDDPRTIEFRALARLCTLGDVDELSPGHRRALGLGEVNCERPSRANPDKPPPERVERRLSDEDRAHALRVLAERPIRRTYERREWTNAVWIELETPPADVDDPADLAERIERAIWRGEYHLRHRHVEIPLTDALLTRRRRNHHVT